MLKKILIGLMLISLLCIGEQADSQSVSKIIGASSQCDTANAGCIPLPFTQGVNLCTSGCARFISPSFTNANVMYGTDGGGCKVSLDAGVTWTNCTTQPFNSGGKEYYTATADGALLGAARGGGAAGGTANDCIFRRSTDHGVTWGTTVIFAGKPCGGAVQGGNNIVCTEADASDNSTCVIIYPNTLTTNAEVVTSTDHGASWSSSFTGTAYTRPNYIAFVSYGVDGIAGSQGAGFSALTYVSGTWAMTATYPAGIAACYGSFIMSGVAYNSCGTSTYTTTKIFNDNTVVVQSPSLPDMYIGAGVAAPLMYSPSPGIIYAAASRNATGQLPIGIWTSRDSGATFGLLYTGSTLANQITIGSILKHPINGCLYVSGGTSTQLIRVC